MVGGAERMERYKELGVADALHRPYDYASACNDLAFILVSSYSKLPKDLQSIIFADILSAFRFLPEVQTRDAIVSANLLVRAAEAWLPKQRKSLAVSEFKHAVIAHKRRGKAHQDGGSLQLPQDILVHIFTFLDMQSLVNGSSVCWAWNSAASDNMLWRLQYSLLFGEFAGETHKLLQDDKGTYLHQTIKGEDALTSLDWRWAFKKRYIDNSTWRGKAHMASCGACGSIIWRSHMSYGRSHCCPHMKKGNPELKPIPPNRMVEYLLWGCNLTYSCDSDDSDSDSPIEQMSRFWTPPRLTSS